MRRKLLRTFVLETSSVQNIPESRAYSSAAQGVPPNSEILQKARAKGSVPTAGRLGAQNLPNISVMQPWITHRSPAASPGQAAQDRDDSWGAAQLPHPHNFKQEEWGIL